jgi:hypothetical protein
MNFSVARDPDVIYNRGAPGTQDVKYRQERDIQVGGEELLRQGGGNISLQEGGMQTPDERLGVKVGNRTDSQAGKSRKT